MWDAVPISRNGLLAFTPEAHFDSGAYCVLCTVQYVCVQGD